MRLPDREDFLDYVENATGQDAEMQKRILQLLASSQVMREHIAELQRDLYVVNAQVPDYLPDAAFGAEVLRLSQAWLQTVYSRKFSLRNFYRSKEFFGLLIALSGLVLLLIAALGLGLVGS